MRLRSRGNGPQGSRPAGAGLRNGRIVQVVVVFQVLLCGVLQARNDSCTYGESNGRQWGKGIRSSHYPAGKQTTRRIYRVWALGSGCACNLLEQLFNAQLFKVLIMLRSRQLANWGWALQGSVQYVYTRGPFM